MNDFDQFPNFTKFQGKNILAIDYGEKVIGMASFTPGREPFPITFGRIINEGLGKSLTEIKQVIDDEVFEVVVFGVPYLTDGSESDKTKQMKEIFTMLKKQSPDVEFFDQDETLTTQAAKDRMANSAQYNFQIDMKKIDEVSAVIILEDFIRRT
jgi:putative Holliday junction resolvase